MPGLENIEVFAALFSLIFVVISWILAIFILSKYFKFRVRELFLVGIAWVGIAMPWTSDGISFILLMTIGEPLNPYAKVIIELTFLPIALIMWLMAFTDLMYKSRQKFVIIISVILSVLFEILFFYALLTDFSLIGEYTPPLAIDYTLPITLFLLAFLGIFLITGIIMGKESMKSENKEIELKGKFLIIAFLSFLVGTLLELFLPLNPVWIMVIRFILISAAIEYYIGFTLPEFIKKIMLK
jgi:hypothetical protein